MAAFLEADGAGQALSSGTAMKKVLVYTIWEDAPGWDTFVLVTSYKIGDSVTQDSKAQVSVTYQVLGELHALDQSIADWKLVKKPVVEKVSFHLERVNGQWKITEPQLAPHLTTSFALEFLRSGNASHTAESLETIKALTTEK